MTSTHQRAEIFMHVYIINFVVLPSVFKRLYARKERKCILGEKKNGNEIVRMSRKLEPHLARVINFRKKLGHVYEYLIVYNPMHGCFSRYIS